MSKEKVIVKLKYPIPLNVDKPDGLKITELVFGRLKAKHLRAMPKHVMTAASQGEEIRLTATEMIPIVAALSNLTEQQADEIDLEDLPNISEVIADFFEQYQETGPESSGR